jgi:hypothetical protein
MQNECDDMKYENLEKEEDGKGDIKTFNFGMRGSKAERSLSSVKYNKKKAKIVKMKKKINSKLKLQFLKNYGFVIEDN